MRLCELPMRFSKYLSHIMANSSIMIMFIAGIGKRNGTRYIIRKKPAEKQNPARPELKTPPDDPLIGGEKSLRGILRARANNPADVAIAQTYWRNGAINPVCLIIETVSSKEMMGNIANAAMRYLRCRMR